MLPTKFRFIWPISFDYSKLINQKQKLPVAVMFVHGSRTKRAISIEDHPYMLHAKFRFIWQSGFRGKYFLEINQSETSIDCGNHVF